MIEMVKFTIESNQRMHRNDIADMQKQFNVNLSDSEDHDTWFDEEIPVGYTTEIDEDEFFARYFSEE